MSNFTKNLLAVFMLCLHFVFVRAQTGINTQNPEPSSALEIFSNNQGVLIPQYELTSLTSATSPINNPAVGSVIYNNVARTSPVIAKGYYYWQGDRWERILVNNEVDQVLKVNKTTGTVIPAGTGNNYITFDDTGIVNSIVGLNYNGNTNSIPLPKGTYKVDVTLDCVAPNSTQSTTGNFVSGANSHLYIMNAALTDGSGNALTDTKVSCNISTYGGASIQGYRFSFILKLNAATTVKLLLNHNNGSSDTTLTQASHSGLVATFYKFFE